LYKVLTFSSTGGLAGGGGNIRAMKFVISHKYEEIVSLDNLLLAWEEFASEKKKRADVRIFARALLHNILSIHRDLTSKAYAHSSYDAFTVSDPKTRNIHKATVRDRLLHRAVYRVLFPPFNKTFISDSYSCRDDKGTHRAFQQLVRMARKVSANYTGPCWAIKMDIKKFFDSIDHKILLKLLAQRINDRQLMDLLKMIIGSFEFSPGKGMPLGNLTSQLFANVYMDPLDKFVKHWLKAKYYLRYADDFLILSSSPEELMGYFVEINTFLKERLKLQIHQNKTSLRKLSQGIDFAGYVALPHYQVPRHRTVKRIFKKINSASNEELEKALPSYFGYIQHASSQKIKDQIEYRIRKKSNSSILENDPTL
jgi:RNA-directed DNA polymerase